MEKHQPRLTVLLADCCSSRTGTGQSAAGTVAPARSQTGSGRAVGSGSVARDLFFRHQGRVIIGAAKAGTTAAGNPRKGGSYFTVAFCSLINVSTSRFDGNRDGLVDWREFFPVLRQETERVSTNDRNRQSPQSFGLGQPFGR